MSEETAIEPQSPTKGRGCIKVSVALWDDLGKPETPEQWHKALLLPDAYEVERVEQVSGVFDIFVLHEAIPVDGDHITQTEVAPFYYVDYHEGQRSQPYLGRIVINQWDGECWKLIAVTDERKPADSPLARE